MKNKILKFACSRNGWNFGVTATYFLLTTIGYAWAWNSTDALERFFRVQFVMGESIAGVLLIFVLYLSNPWFIGKEK